MAGRAHSASDRTAGRGCSVSAARNIGHVCAMASMEPGAGPEAESDSLAAADLLAGAGCLTRVIEAQASE